MFQEYLPSCQVIFNKDDSHRIPTKKQPNEKSHQTGHQTIKKLESKITPSTSTLIIPVSDLNDEAGKIHLENQLKKLPGVLSAEAAFLHQSLKIVFHPAQIACSELIHQIRSAGYKPEIVTEKFRIEGMHCASCVARVEKFLVRLPWIVRASVSLSDSSALIEYIPSPDSIPSIEKIVRDAGYTLIRNSSLQEDLSEPLHNKQDRRLKLKAMIAFLFTTPVAILSMRMPELDYFNFLLLALTLPVVLYSGRDFYITAFRQAMRKTVGMDALIAVGTGSAFIYSLAVTFFPARITASGQDAHVYYETTAVMITLMLTG